MLKPKLWNDKDLEGYWLFTYKVDGVRAIIVDGVAKSRSDKPLYNLGAIPDGDYEIFKNNWEESVSLVRTRDIGYDIPLEYAYSLYPLDGRLSISAESDPTKGIIELYLKKALALGYEGLVLRQGNDWLKVKSVESHDVVIIDLIEGKGRNVGRLGAFVTDKGNVGTGLNDADREKYWDRKYIGETIEVECMSLTPNGKFRMPRFKRIRWDKSNEV